jgi:hypothetical protein
MAALTSYQHPLAIGPVTILSGASLSDSIDLQGARPVSLRLPAAWTAASITFQASEDGITFGDLYNALGEVTYPAAASRFISLTPQDFLGCRAIKVRSGTAGTPVNQGADRTIVVTGASIT